MQTQTVDPDVERKRPRLRQKQIIPALRDLQPGDYLSICSKKKELSFLKAKGGGIVPWKDYTNSQAYGIIFEDIPVMPGEAKLIFWYHYHLETAVIIVDHDSKSFVLKVCGQKRPKA
jgi:hypothetical protein